jgi:hypothetical protein
LQRFRIIQNFLAHLRAEIAGQGIPKEALLFIKAQAAPQRGFVPGLLLGDLLEQALELRVIRLFSQGQVALPGLQLMGNGQFDGLLHKFFQKHSLNKTSCEKFLGRPSPYATISNNM